MARWVTSSAKLESWYGPAADRLGLDLAYSDRGAAVGAGWLGSDNEAVRLIGADALLRQRQQFVKPLDRTQSALSTEIAVRSVILFIQMFHTSFLQPFVQNAMTEMKIKLIL